jgi:TetR/AcrR family transcriptional regulator, regulator of cefoperazone and chloramphenicol sensitivity
MNATVMIDAAAQERSFLSDHLQTRPRILSEAMILFAAQGFRNTTIRDLAARAGVNIAAINYHFRSKDDLYAEVVNNALQEYASEIIAAERTTEGALADLSGLESFIRGVVTSLIAPAIKREGSQHLIRLLAWSILDKPKASDDSWAHILTSSLSPVFMRCLLGRRLTVPVTFALHWLIGQCLLVSPVLVQPLQPPLTHATQSAALSSVIEPLVAASMAGIISWLDQPET